jgi:uncharacterized protein YbjT (DUF2867 family)
VKVLLTGGTGFVGPAVLRAISEQGHEVRALVRDEKSAGTAAALGADPFLGDMTEAASLQEAVEGVDAVVHLVGIRQGKPEDFQRIMVGGTHDLIDAANAAGVKRFVLMSALGVTDETKDEVPYYGAKWEQERLLRESGLEHVIFRPCFVFGRDGGILTTFRKIAKIAPVTPIIGSGEQRIQPIWIDDLGAYFARALEEPAAANRTFEIGGPDRVSWNEFWARLKDALGVRRPSIHMPMGFMRANAVVTERLPGDIPLTRDLLRMMELGDNVVSNDDALETFKLPLVPLDDQLRRAA